MLASWMSNVAFCPALTSLFVGTVSAENLVVRGQSKSLDQRAEGGEAGGHERDAPAIRMFDDRSVTSGSVVHFHCRKAVEAERAAHVVCSHLRPTTAGELLSRSDRDKG